MVSWTTTSQPLKGSNSQEYVPKKGFHKWTHKVRPAQQLSHIFSCQTTQWTCHALLPTSLSESSRLRVESSVLLSVGVRILVIFFFPYNPPPIPTNQRDWLRSISAPFRSVSGPFRLRFGCVSGPFRVRFGVLRGVGVGSGRGASVREKNINMLDSLTLL